MVDFHNFWGPNSKCLDFNLTIGNHSKECDCPKNRETLSLARDSSLFSAGVFYGTSDGVNVAYAIAFSLKSDYMAVKNIEYQKTPLELISEIGGHLGLMAGASVLTFIEMAQLCLVIFFSKRKPETETRTHSLV